VTIVLVAVAGEPGAQPQPAPATGRVVVSGMVTDEATKSAVLVRLRDLYGADRVVDEVSVGPVVSPPIGAPTWKKSLHPI
jgi:OOP family OmpA-OmpF porin